MLRAAGTLKVAALLALALLAGWIYFVSRTPAEKQEREVFFRRAMGHEPVGSAKGLEAVRQIASYEDDTSAEMLLAIIAASTRNEFKPFPVVADAAIQALSEWGDPYVAARLAAFMQPHHSIGTRRKIAEALGRMSCEEECIVRVLHYLERLWRGELNSEDKITHPPDEIKELKTFWKEEQKKVASRLHEIVRNRRSTAIPLLWDVYGLGSENPSGFALDLVTRLELRESCVLLLRSREKLKAPFPGYVGSLPEVEAAIKTLRCPDQPSP